MTKNERVAGYMEFLVKEGYRPEIDQDGDVKFKREGRTYYIITDEKDEEYFRIVFPNFWSIDDELERQQVLVACDYSNAKSKVSKLYVANNDVWAALEVYLQEPTAYRALFERYMSSLANAVKNFVEKMRELRPTTTLGNAERTDK